MAIDNLVYNATHQVVVCRRCQSCIVPRKGSIECHLRAEPHRLLGETLKAHVAFVETLALRDVKELRREKPKKAGLPIEQLQVRHGFCCLLCAPDAPFYTAHLLRMRDHVPSHKRSAREHKLTPLWEECLLQTYFESRTLVDYFPVSELKQQGGASHGRPSELLTKPEEDLFDKLKQDCDAVDVDTKEQAGTVEDFGDSRSARVPWLERTDFPAHLARLKDVEIKSSYSLPARSAVAASDVEADNRRTLLRILAATETVLRDAYRLCSDASGEQKMTQQRALILNEFYAGASGRANGFRYFKNASTLPLMRRAF